MGYKIADCHWLILLYQHHYFVFPGHRHQIEEPTLQVVYTTVPSVMLAAAEAAVWMVALSIQLCMVGLALTSLAMLSQLFMGGSVLFIMVESLTWLMC